MFLITDGVLPSNEGRGYVLRRILRRAVYHLTQLSGATDGTLLEKVADAVIERMERAYPDVRDRASFTTRLLAAEESKFRETLERGTARLNGILDLRQELLSIVDDMETKKPSIRSERAKPTGSRNAA